MTTFTFDTEKGYFDVIAKDKNEAIKIFKNTYPNIKINKRKIYQMAERVKSPAEAKHEAYVGNVWSSPYLNTAETGKI